MNASGQLLREALRFLDPRAGPVAAPVRAVLFGQERFHQHGVSLAQAQPVERRRAWRRRRLRAPHFFPRLGANVRMLERMRAYMELLESEGDALSPAADWLLDNFHLIEGQLPEIHTGMPRGYYAELPKLRQAPLAGLPRVYGIAWAFVAHTDSNFDADLLAHFLQAYQKIDLLTLGELWALPSTLRVILMENLGRLAEVIATTKAARELANWCCDEEQALTPRRLQAFYERTRRRGVHPVFLAQMVQRVRDPALLAPSRWLGWVADNVPDADALLASVQEAQAADNVSVSNAVTALRAINNLDWVERIEAVSPVLQTLRRAPAFVADSELTRDQTTHEIERLARRLHRSELQVAQQVLALSEAAGGAPEQGPAHWVIGSGRAALLQSLGASSRLAERRGLRLLQRWRASLYGGTLALGAAALLAWLARHGTGYTPLGALALLLMAFPATECVVALLHRMLAEAVRVQRLPRLALEEGLQAEQRTLLVVPCLLSSEATVQALLERLELHYLANPEAHAQYALLSDWLDAPCCTTARDQPLLDLALRGVTALNERHARAGAPPFLLLHRERLWCGSERVWMGWERKRGKIEQLLALLAEPGAGAASPFVDLGTASRLQGGERFVVVLDADTELPTGALREMVAIAAHPLNEPRIDAARRRVVAGYGILQPRVATPYPAAHEATAYGWFSASSWGTDAYNSGSSEIYQDVFGEGSFYGKGLFNVRAVHEVLQGRAAPGRLLSHDLFEGLWARCAHLSDVVVLEAAPMHPDVAASRLHRWTRGDWQLLAFLGAVLGGKVGGLNVWKVLDNLRRSLLAPACVALLWLSFATRAVPPGLALALVLAALALGPLLGALSALAPSRMHVAFGHLLREGLHELARVLAGALWQLATLLQNAALQTDAMVRALWRMTLSHRHLLQWTTAAQAQAAAHRDWWGFCRRHGGSSALALAWAGAGLAWPGAAPAWLLGFGLLWAATPLWFWLVAQPLHPARPALAEVERAYLTGVARDTWSYFEACVTEQDHHLPPDNLQLEPQAMLAHRSSPTNIGLYLLSALCAWRFGFIAVEQLAQRLDRTLASLQQLPRHRGHFYNWTETQTLQTLPPAYVSTVDSGNLAASLWALAQACRDIAALPGADAPAWLARARDADAIVAAMDFRFLYDRRRRLFHIGYRLDDATLDPAYYDLLASEARLSSYLAIAKGDVPVRHWAALGRPFLEFEHRPTLRSWSGSMFEYLMPSLLLDEPRGGLLQRVIAVAVAAQREFGARHGIPWGVSECAYFAQDHTLAFQYSPFGVPSLALRRTPPLDRVVAPYAGLLALLVDAPAAVANLHRIEACGGRGRHGFIEALDFSLPRAGDSSGVQPVATFMAHHQGMTLLALCNVLCDAAPRAWFGRAPQVRAHAALLQERMPREIVLQAPTLSRIPHVEAQAQAAAIGAAREFELASAQPLALRPTQWLGNGSYSLSIRPNGAGQSSWRGRTLNRARDDALRDAYGCWLLLRRVDASPGFHSLTQAPQPLPGGRYRARFFNDHAEFLLDGEDFDAATAVWVSADEDIEFRRVTLHNLRDEALELELLSYFEATLAPQAADESHPAFSNLFVAAHRSVANCALLERRARLPDEQGMWAAHFLAACDVAPEAVSVCCEREALLPRLGRLAQLRAGADGATAQGLPDGRLATGLDPVASLCVRLRLAPRTRATLTFATAAGPDAETLLSLVDEYRQEVHIARDRLMSAALARIRQRELGIDAADQQAAQDLSSLMVMNLSRRRALPMAALDRRALWRFGISGDRPIVVVRIHAALGLGVVRRLMAIHRLWEIAGLPTDLIVVNGEPGSYLMPLQAHLAALRNSLGSAQHRQPQRGSVELLRQSDLSAAEAAALQGCARIDLLADDRPLGRLTAQALAAATPPRPALAVAAQPWPDAWAPNRFERAGRDFVIDIDARHVTPRPWANVLANPDFGCLLTESGAGYTWAGNSRMNQLSPWSNDALLDPPGEHFLLQDLDSGAPYGLLPTLDRNGAAGYRVRHTQGMSEFLQRRGTLEIAVQVAVHPQEAVKCLQFRLHNGGAEARSLRLLGCVEWVLGSQRRERMTLATEYVHEVQAVLARQLEHQGSFGEGTAFLMLAGAPVQHWTCARSEFFDALGGFALPEALQGIGGFGLDPCGALEAPLRLEPGASFEGFWVIGYAAGREAALSLARRMRAPGALAEVATLATQAWDERLSAVQVQTPDPLFDAMVNRWWLYQAVGCRMWAKAGFYQASGATGFRDQLQDAMALAWIAPQAAREQILLHAARQFPEGDVQHWWHAPGGAGVRTRFSDDLLWLPYVIQHYLDCSGELALLDAELPFVEGPAVPEGAEDAYYAPGTSNERATLYEHAARAIDHALRFGAHGLPLMGCGDWNDGMNRVGHAGRGESVWLAWFLLAILPRWEALAGQRADHERATRWAAARAALRTAVDTQGWDGAWYRRAYFDNGQPLGSELNGECSIDLIAQAWSVLAAPPGDARARQAMAAADARLVDRRHGLLRLLDPPLQDAPDNAGYIQAYPPGVRENGGQYSHGASWAVLAQAQLGNAALAWEYFCMLSPAHRAQTEAQQRRYRIEPYVMPGDTYTAPPYEGWGGWSWYSGSAAWMHRAALEGILGLAVRADAFRLQPCLPPHWDEAQLRLRLHGKTLQLSLRRAAVPPAEGVRLARVGEWIDTTGLPTECSVCVLLAA